MKPIDFETLFETKLRQYMRENAGKYTAEQWEKLIPKLYQSFGETYIKAAGATPKEYFAKMSDGELTQALADCVREKIPVSDFLVRELEKRECPEELSAMMRGAGEELALALINAAGDGERAGEFYFSVLIGDFPDKVKDAAQEKFKEFPLEPYLDRAVESYFACRGREYMLELFSSGKIYDDRILEIFKDALRTADERLPIVAGLVARYGDERALGVLLELIDREETGFVAYRELLCAIEALGGNYDKERDFSADRDFLVIKENSEKERK